jgi:hypothetical protein
MKKHHHERVNLCILSDAVGGRYEDADCFHKPCPLQLTKAQAKHCPCKTRKQVGRVGSDGYMRPASEQVVQVLACLFPLTWNGDTVRNPEAFADFVRRKAAGS